MRLLPVDTISRNAVGRTGFEPVTSPVSGNFRDGSGCLPPSGWVERGALTWANILGGSGWVWGRLMALALICGSHGFGLPVEQDRQGLWRGLATCPVFAADRLANLSSNIVLMRRVQGREYEPDGGVARDLATGRSVPGAGQLPGGKGSGGGAGGDVRSAPGDNARFGAVWQRARIGAYCVAVRDRRACGRPQDRPGRIRPVS